MRRKEVPALPRPARPTPLAPSVAIAPQGYAAWTVAKLRALGLAAAVVAPLGALAGSVAACGGAAPVQHSPYGYRAEPAAPPAPTASASAVPSVEPAQAPQPATQPTPVPTPM